LIRLPVTGFKRIQRAVLVSLWDRSPFEQPGRLLPQPAFTGLGIALSIGLDSQTQAGVFTDRTNFAHGAKPKNTPSEELSPGQQGVGTAGVLWKESEK
jgi:hypothetical protein